MFWQNKKNSIFWRVSCDSRFSQKMALNLLRQNIVFSRSERIPVSFSWLFHYFSFIFWLFYVLINFYKNYFTIILSYFFFHEKYFNFSMFRDVRNVPGCSMFRVLSTPQSYTFEPSTTFFVPCACFYICFQTFLYVNKLHTNRKDK